MLGIFKVLCDSLANSCYENAKPELPAFRSSSLYERGLGDLRPLWFSKGSLFFWLSISSSLMWSAEFIEEELPMTWAMSRSVTDLLFSLLKVSTSVSIYSSSKSPPSCPIYRGVSTSKRGVTLPMLCPLSSLNRWPMTSSFSSVRPDTSWSFSML